MRLHDLVTCLRRDFERRAPGEGRLTLLIFRTGQYAAADRRRRFGLWLLWGVADRIYLRTCLGAELPSTVRCGPGLRLPHSGRGVVLHPDVEIGSDATIYHAVTIGMLDDPPVPVLGDRVLVGVGARILGAVSIGSDARIGANAVVVRDVAEGTTATGVPTHMSRLA